MKIIVGLGNPGITYEKTRHNVGFLVVDHFLKGKDVISCESKFNGNICEMHFHETKTFFVKPKTFMNDSGSAIKEIAKFYKIDAARDLLVVHDEVDLPFLEIRSTHSSGPAGHNGVKSIIESLGSQDFHRVRIGVEARASRNDIPTDVFVLSPFSEFELKKLESDVYPRIDQLIMDFIQK